MSEVAYSPPRIAPAGDAALVVELGEGIDDAVNRRVHALARALEHAGIDGLIDLVPTYRSLLVCYDPVRARFAMLESLVRDALGALDRTNAQPARVVEIPTCYGGEHGPDLPFVASHARLAPDEVVRVHAAGRYTVFMMGFSPGFAYLGGMPPEIAAPRLKTPRTRIPAGSVGIAQQQTGIYPVESPGGWQLIGRTPLLLFDPRRTPPTTLQPGDTIRFVPIDAERYEELERQQSRDHGREAVPSPKADPAGQGSSPRSDAAGQGFSLAGEHGFEPAIEVLNGGGFTTVQDLGRYGFQRYGVPVSGAMDTFALRIANLLVGNAEGAAALEMTITGAELLFVASATIAIAGADLRPRLDDQYAPMWRPFVVPAGSVLTFRGCRAGARAYLAVAGGIDVPPVLNSRSTYIRSGLGGFRGRALQAGDVVAIGPPGQPDSGRALPPSFFPAYLGGHRVRVLLGPQQDGFTRRGIDTLLGSAYTIAPQSDRMGYRLEGPAVEHRGRADIVSDGSPAGAVQVPGDGQPLVLLADRGTTGGYAKIATVITADLPRLAQSRAGDRVFFDAVGENEARAALIRHETVVEALRRAPLSRIGADGRLARATATTARSAEDSPETAASVDAKAPLPGKVIEIVVQAGDPVVRGQTLCVLEAMKMHNAIAAPRTGRIAAIHVKVGDPVSDGDVLVVIE
ncbi:MAG: 5-oxoprolinase subunit PxpB [Bacteroidales bacterium]